MAGGLGSDAAGPRAADAQRAAKEYLEASARHLAELAGGEVPALAVRAAGVLADAIRGGGKVLFCGNGGSAADAQHLAAELVGRLDASRDRDALPAVALTTDTSILTAVANDYGYERVFARQVAALGRPGDALVCISTSGRSANVVAAAREARDRDLRVVALVGSGPSPFDEDALAEVALHVAGQASGQVQQGHITVGHLLCALAENLLGER
ncbi:MAG TPA: SIS domain-containing protein [Actinomycetota bacterium]|nr:SIS domain-containing protein [Actinomycetota bacterium]